MVPIAGVDVVFGHSSHHVKAMERHGRGLIMYGAGEALDDYEVRTRLLCIRSEVSYVSLCDFASSFGS